MADYWEAWLTGGDLYDRRTRDAVERAGEEQARARNQLAGQMRAQAGNLQGQIDRLTEALVALVEHEDVRGELAGHADAAACRTYARAVVPQLVVTGGAGLGSVPAAPDVPGYWLSHAVRGLVAGATGGDGAPALAQARRLDARRTAFLLVLIDAVRREQRLGAADVGSTLPDDLQVTGAERLVWVAITDGRLGDAASRLLEDRLRALLGAPDRALVEAWVRALVPEQRDVPGPVRAARTLTALSRALEPEGGQHRGAPTGDQAPTPAPGSEQQAEDPLADALRALVDEGAPEEAAIMLRMADIRRRMGFVVDQAAAAGSTWDAPGSAVPVLLLDDLRRLQDNPADVRGRLALRLLAPALRDVVATLRDETALRVDDVRVTTNGRGVVVGPDGPRDPGWRADLAREVAGEHPTSPLLRPAGYAALALGVLGLVLVLLSPVWLVLAVVGLLVGAGLLVHDRRTRRGQQHSVERRLGRADDDVRRATEQQAERRRLSGEATTQTAAALPRIDRALGATSPPPGPTPDQTPDPTPQAVVR